MGTTNIVHFSKVTELLIKVKDEYNKDLFSLINVQTHYDNLNMTNTRKIYVSKLISITCV